MDKAEARDQAAISVAMEPLSPAADLRLPLHLAFEVVSARASRGAALRRKAAFLAVVRSRTRPASSLQPTLRAS